MEGMLTLSIRHVQVPVPLFRHSQRKVSTPEVLQLHDEAPCYNCHIPPPPSLALSLACLLA